MFDCAGRIGENTVVNCGVAPQMYRQLPRNFSTVSRSSSKDDHKQEEELRELIRAVSTKFGEAKVEIIKPISVSAVEKRSYSVGIGRMGRIDEEMPCDFREYDAAANAYPREIFG
ncbi:hypothetical protein ACH5RR_022277 [Cinchona calisaya]|uniref:Uncharacterized protein n=1 Tax=Cinchona calisaya TaxID=153742 RepID=A0ABD2Z7D3_9GENT